MTLLMEPIGVCEGVQERVRDCEVGSEKAVQEDLEEVGYG